jgi:hypothetical protein
VIVNDSEETAKDWNAKDWEEMAYELRCLLLEALRRTPVQDAADLVAAYRRGRAITLNITPRTISQNDEATTDQCTFQWGHRPTMLFAPDFAEAGISTSFSEMESHPAYEVRKLNQLLGGNES